MRKGMLVVTLLIGLVALRLCYVYGPVYGSYVDIVGMLAFLTSVVILAFQFDDNLAQIIVLGVGALSLGGLAHVASIQKNALSEQLIDVSEGTADAIIKSVRKADFSGARGFHDSTFHPWSIVYTYNVNGKAYTQRDYAMATKLKRGQHVSVMYSLGEPAVSRIVASALKK